ncbi:hypothetical protein [Flavobacterium hibisci]|uniref:hypothetical protein n=1 Tax=Flavobacterium hibisci TaxID=1914462 RepID=UPI001CBC3788|nr:hypothetical protein [Flavobacterium hibisci]MBZ4044506.1 hypothetical protein [Flavobacterium hibisci]
MNSQKRKSLIMELIPFLNQLQNTYAENETFQIVAVVRMPITFRDLMALSDTELEELEKLMLSAKAAKRTERGNTQYMKNMPNYNLVHETGKNYKIK